MREDTIEQEPIPCEETFLEERPILLTPEEQKAFFDAIMSPPKPNAALRKLMKGTAPKPAKRKKA